MKLHIKQLKWSPISFSQAYVLSLVAAMVFLLIRKSELLVQTNWMAPSTLETLKNQINGNRALFLFVLKERIAIVLALFVLGTTYLGNVFAYLNVIWFGASSGFFLTIVMLRYGLKGIFLLFSGMFPHYLIYVPAMMLTLSLVREKRVVNRKYFLQIFVILLVVITGCILECYVNPYVLTKTIKNFKL